MVQSVEFRWQSRRLAALSAGEHTPKRFRNAMESPQPSLSINAEDSVHQRRESINVEAIDVFNNDEVRKRFR